MRIGIDAMGGDYAPEQAVLGAIQAVNLHPSIFMVLYGQKLEIEKYLPPNTKNIEIVDCTEIVEMGEHPVRGITQKKDSSMVKGLMALAMKQLDGFLSAGNTGAMLVGSIGIIKPITGVLRPCITSVIPRPDKNPGVLLDAGANADIKPEHLIQFAKLGSIYYKTLYSETAKVGLLNIGSEAEKGNMLCKAAYPLLGEVTDIDFIGNIEARDMFDNNADVVVCDGFSGNIIIKVCEGLFYKLAKRGVKDEYLEKFNFKHYGGSAILGINAPVIVGHGISKADTIVKMIELTMKTIEDKMVEKIETSFKNQTLH